MIAQVALALALLTQVLDAQGPFYVNGLTGADVPGAGQAAASPWKTIGYALAHIPPQTPSTSEILYVEGNQVYSSATNGEVFPITPTYNVWIEGTFLQHGNMPVLQPGPGGTAIQLPADESFLRNDVTYRYLVFEGGDYGIRMGSNPGHRHRPRVQDCTFRHQTQAAISIRPNGTSGDDPRFFQNTFEDVQIGVEAVASGDNGHVAPDVDECTFLRCGTGVAMTAGLLPSFATATAVLGQVRSCNFQDCHTGIRVESSGADSWYDVAITHCRLAHCTAGIRATSMTVNNGYPQEHLAIADCVVRDCATGIWLERPYGMGSQRHALEIDRTAIRDCGLGIRQQAYYSFHHRATFTDVTIASCQTGWGIHEAGDPALSQITARRCVVTDCDVGIDSYIDSDGSFLRLDSTILAGCSTVALRHHGFPGQLEPNNIGFPTHLHLDGVTLADNTLGLAVVRTWCPADVTNTAFGGNAQDIQLAANVQFTIGHSCLQSSSWPGTGNLNVTDPQFVRPYYKLAPMSPCIDAAATTATSPTTDYEGDPRAAVGTPNGPALPDIGADEYIDAGSAHRYGVGGFGAFNVFPRISSPNQTVRIGQPLQVFLSGAIMPTFLVTADFAILTLGWTEDSGALPFDLAQYGMTGSFLWNEPFASFALTPVTATGTALLTHTIPNSTLLVGLTFTHQWFALMPGVYGVIGSDGLRVTIGR